MSGGAASSFAPSSSISRASRFQKYSIRAGRRRITTFKKLPDKDKDGITEKKAIALMLAQPSMIKRPVLEVGGGKVLVGFKPEEYAALK